MALISMLFEILKRGTFWDVLMELLMFMLPLWLAVVVGVVLGWAWRPKWANMGRNFSDNSRANDSSSASSFSSGIFPGFNRIPSLISLKLLFPSSVPWFLVNGVEDAALSATQASESDSSLSKHESNSSALVNEADLRHLWQLVEMKDEGPSWIKMMDRSTANMSYQAWRRDPQTGPPQYRSRTVFEDATPEIVRDCFWDDEFRMKWDDMLLQHATLEECQTTGAMMVHWVRKFPFFCSDREYVIGRRIWECGRSYYCVTKGVPCSSLPRRNKPRRVDLYYSSWCIRAVESRKGDGQLTACEVLLFHHEDMGIPWEIAKLGIRQGMWGAVKKIDPGLRAYQKERASGAPLSHCAFMAQINTRVGADYLRSLESDDNELLVKDDSSGKRSGINIPKVLIVGGAIALACSLDQGLLTKAVIFGVARRFVKMGKKL
ncbi:hypothetical protein Nepgr_011449 [Nepenthes gracilis]|uniref:START domain-containing protein n=1 Tax=Nepenthes gracilis TaxID=150966 RepID=A0AAD3SED2_NEPGR|nr:hypothetical protein Nepgr_011449 [Nepenthes gracilis]